MPIEYTITAAHVVEDTQYLYPSHLFTARNLPSLQVERRSNQPDGGAAS